jgi:hypothetical protein
MDAPRNRYLNARNSLRASTRAGELSPNFKPGSFITISGTHLADAATADTIPPPTVLGGSCVTFGDIAVPLLVSSSGQIQAGAGHAPSGNARGGSALAEHGAGVRPGSGHGEAGELGAAGGRSLEQLGVAPGAHKDQLGLRRFVE